MYETESGEDILSEKIKAYRESLKAEKPELDIALLLRIFDIVNDSSEVKIAIDPVDPEGGWSPSAQTYAVAGAKILEDDGRIVLRVHDEKHGIESGKLAEQITKLLKRDSGKGTPVLFVRKGEVVRLTDVYSHALVREVFAGMPSDVVLAVEHPKELSQEQAQ